MNKVVFLSLILFSNLCLATAGAIDRMRDGFPDLPKDAQAVAERSLGCQHFWGEANGTGDERDKEVAQQLKQLRCNRIKRDLDKIRAKYRKNDKVLKILQEAALG